MIGYGVCCGSWQQLADYVLPVVGDKPLLALSGQTAIADAYNAIFEAFALDDDLDALVLLHADLEIIDPAFEDKVMAALEDPGVAIVGVCGATEVKSLDWWSYATLGHQMTDSYLLDFPGGRSGDADMLEGSLMAFSPWAVRNLRFDVGYGNFHGYDDIALTARQHGKRVTVADIDTHHHTTVGYQPGSLKAQQWASAAERFHQKWEF